MNLNKGENVARMVLGSLLWGLSGTLTGVLFLTFSLGDPWRAGILILMALGLEGSKILSWRMGGKARLLSWVLISLSVFSSFGAALETVRILDKDIERHQVSVDVLEVERESLDLQILDLQKRIRELPPTWLTWYRTLTSDLEKLQTQRKVASQDFDISDQQIQERGGKSRVFQEISTFTGVNQRFLEMIILMIMAVSLEWSALLLVGKDSGEKSVRGLPNTKSPKDQAEIFLKKMIEMGDGTYLGGRDRVGRALGLGPYESKKVFDRLVMDKLIYSEGLRTRIINKG